MRGEAAVGCAKRRVLAMHSCLRFQGCGHHVPKFTGPVRWPVPRSVTHSITRSRRRVRRLPAARRSP